MDHFKLGPQHEEMRYERCGASGLRLPMLSLGLWHNFGGITPFEVQRDLILTALELGITHFDLANNYGPEAGAAETNFGRMIDEGLRVHRDEIVVATKAGYTMWDGPYGKGGSRKHLLSSLDQSLKRMKMDYVDIFYHHCPDEETPLEESMEALCTAVRSGKALYVGLSNYNAEQTKAAAELLRREKVPCLIHQAKYSMFDRRPERGGLFEELKKQGIGCIVYAPLFHGQLTDRYKDGIPPDSRASHDPRFLKPQDISENNLKRAEALRVIAGKRGQSLAQMALAWAIRPRCVASALLGASKPEQLRENVVALKNTEFSEEELAQIEQILAQ